MSSLRRWTLRDYPDDRSMNDALAQLVVDVINENMPELGWQDQKSIIVKVEKG